jgi:hypothetical protein
MISELYSAANESSIGINYDEDTETIILWRDEENSTIYCRKSEITEAIDNIFQGRHNRDILKQTAEVNPSSHLGTIKYPTLHWKSQSVEFIHID